MQMPLINQRGNRVQLTDEENQTIKARNDVVEEYINSWDNNHLNNNPSKNKSNAQEDEDDVFSLAWTTWAKQKKVSKTLALNNTIDPEVKGTKHIKNILRSNNINTNTNTNELNSKWSNSSIYNINRQRVNSKCKSNSSRRASTNEMKIKKRNNTARNTTVKLNWHMNNTNINNNIKLNNQESKYNTSSKLKEKHNLYSNIMNDPSNPYSTNWANKLLDKQYNMKLGINGFLNGVPIISVGKKNKLPVITKKEIKEKLNRIQNKEDIPNDILKEFSTNRKNFFQVRKDIIEDPYENDLNDSDDNKEKIELPKLF